MNFSEAYKKYFEFSSNLEEPDWSVHIEDINQNKVRVMNEQEFEAQLLSDKKFRDFWSNGCVQELTLQERANIFFLQHPDWALNFEHAFFDGHKIPRRIILKD